MVDTYYEVVELPSPGKKMCSSRRHFEKKQEKKSTNYTYPLTRKHQWEDSSKFSESATSDASESLSNELEQERRAKSEQNLSVGGKVAKKIKRFFQSNVRSRSALTTPETLGYGLPRKECRQNDYQTSFTSSKGILITQSGSDNVSGTDNNSFGTDSYENASVDILRYQGPHPATPKKRRRGVVLPEHAAKLSVESSESSDENQHENSGADHHEEVFESDICGESILAPTANKEEKNFTSKVTMEAPSKECSHRNSGLKPYSESDEEGSDYTNVSEKAKLRKQIPTLPLKKQIAGEEIETNRKGLVVAGISRFEKNVSGLKTDTGTDNGYIDMKGENIVKEEKAEASVRVRVKDSVSKFESTDIEKKCYTGEKSSRLGKGINNTDKNCLRSHADTGFRDARCDYVSMKAQVLARQAEAENKAQKPNITAKKPTNLTSRDYINAKEEGFKSPLYKKGYSSVQRNENIGGYNDRSAKQKPKFHMKTFPKRDSDSETEDEHSISASKHYQPGKKESDTEKAEDETLNPNAISDNSVPHNYMNMKEEGLSRPDIGPLRPDVRRNWWHKHMNTGIDRSGKLKPKCDVSEIPKRDSDSETDSEYIDMEEEGFEKVKVSFDGLCALNEDMRVNSYINVQKVAKESFHQGQKTTYKTPVLQYKQKHLQTDRPKFSPAVIGDYDMPTLPVKKVVKLSQEKIRSDSDSKECSEKNIVTETKAKRDTKAILMKNVVKEFQARDKVYKDNHGQKDKETQGKDKNESDIKTLSVKEIAREMEGFDMANSGSNKLQKETVVKDDQEINKNDSHSSRMQREVTVKDEQEINKNDSHSRRLQKEVTVKDEDTGTEGFNVKLLTICDICEKLDELGLSEYKEQFVKQKIDGHMASTIEEEDYMTELGMSKLEAKRMVSFVKSGHIPR